MPICSIDRERAYGVQPMASLLFDKIGAAGTLMVSCAEHNGLITAGGFVAKIG
ncbi:MAG: hypothetical protein AAF729_10925 [Pseudomonadota bacterium]